MYKLNGGLPYNTDCFSYWQGTIQASYAVMRQLLFGYNRVERWIPKMYRLYRNGHKWSFLAHLSQRLIGELTGNSWSGVRPSLTISNIFSKTACLIKAKFYVEPPWVGGTKVCSRHLGHMTKMAATPIYGKNPSKIFSRTGRQIFTKLGM